jgi:hypothetical protein
MSQIVEVIKNLKNKLVIRMNENFIDGFFKNEDVLANFSNINENREVFIKNYEKALIALIKYEKKPTYYNWQNIMPFCFTSNFESSPNHFYESSHLNPIFYYALKFNILDVSHIKLDKLNHYEWDKEKNAFSLIHPKMVNESMLCIVATHYIDAIPYLVKHDKININTINTYSILSRVVLRIAEKPKKEHVSFFNSVLKPLEDKGVDIEALRQSNTYQEVKNLCQDYQHYLIEKEAEHLDKAIFNKTPSPVNKRKNKI